MCTHCMEELAQFRAASEGRAESIGHAINTSVASGADGVPAELLCWARHEKYDPSDDAKDDGFTTGMRKSYCRALAGLYNGMMRTGTVPPNFTEAIVSLVRKEAKDGEALDYSLFDSYRPISCINTMHKILKLAITRRVSHLCTAAGLLGSQQAGFSHRLATEHDIFVLLEAVRRRAIAKGGKTYALFVDLKRAYDSVNHAAVIKVLETVGVAPQMCGLIRALLADATFRLDVNGGLSEPIALDVGLPQGDPLSPVLFLLYIESLCRALDGIDVGLPEPAAAAGGGVAVAQGPVRRGLLTAGQLLRDLLYADDVAVLSATFEDLVAARRVMEEWGVAWGMTFNPKPGKTEYLLFVREGEEGWLPHVPPTLHEILFGGKNKKNGAGEPSLLPPPPPSRDPILYGEAQGWGRASHYRYLGVILTSTRDWNAHWERAIKGTVWKYRAFVFHRSSIVSFMSVARLLQLRKTMAQPYAWSSLPVPPEVLCYWDKFLVDTAMAALRFSGANTSHFLVTSLSATPSARALQLRERLRLFMALRAHVSRRAPPGYPRHASVSLFDALLAEFRAWGAAGPPDGTPSNWVADVAALLDDAARIMPFRVSLEELSVDYAFEIRDFLRPFITGFTYFEARRGVSDSILPCDRRMGPEPPRTNGSKRAAISRCFGLTADAERCFKPGSRGPPLSELGPGLHHPITLATEGGRHQPLINLLMGDGALRRSPWVPMGADGNLLPIPVPSGTEPPPAIWGSAAGCAMCGRTDGSFHAFCSCAHPMMAAARTGIARDAAAKLLPLLVSELRKLSQLPADGGPPLDPELTPAQEAALSGIKDLPVDGPLSNEFQHILHRLVTASPWPRRAAQEGHHLAAALGALFDSVIAAPQCLRNVMNRWICWADVAIIKMAKARWAALEAEARSPTLPRPPPWVPPPPAEGVGGDLDPVRPPKASSPVSLLLRRGPVRANWYRGCNIPFLVDLAMRARCDASIAPRFPAGAAAMLGRARKDWYVDFLVSLALTQEDISRLFPPSPVVLSLLHAPAPVAHHVA